MFANSDTTTFIAFSLFLGLMFWWYLALKKDKIAVTDSAWVLFASQTGNAQAIAEQTAKQLSQDGLQWRAADLSSWLGQHTFDDLNNQHTLFIVSTQGDGDPPDNGIGFFNQLLQFDRLLNNATFAILGLGDSRYDKFCGFAQNLNDRLIQLNATPIFPCIKVNNLDEIALEEWQQQLEIYLNTRLILDNIAKSIPIRATLSTRQQENKHSPSAGLFWLDFNLHKNIDWQAGDIAELEIPKKNGETALRNYTIANIPNTDNTLALLVRQLVKDSGDMGLGSGYLTHRLCENQSVKLTIKNNPRFHLPKKPTPVIFIATGSGLAGIIALLSEAQNDWGGGIKHHLIYGERHPNLDTPCRERLDILQQSGILKTVDYCFSKGKAQYAYVQDALLGQQSAVAKQIRDGAMVYVCGSKTALSDSIPEVLAQCLGEKDYKTFLERDGLRLDTY